MEIDEALKEIERLSGELKKFDGIDPVQVKANNQTLSEQLNSTKSTYESYKQSAEGRIQDLESQLTRRDIHSQFVNSYTGAKGLPGYEDVLFNAVASNFELKDGVALDKTSGKPVAETIADYRAKYPAMFAPDGDGSGSGAAGSSSSKTESPTVIEAKNGVISGVDPDSFLDGKVVLK